MKFIITSGGKDGLVWVFEVLENQYFSATAWATFTGLLRSIHDHRTTEKTDSFRQLDLSWSWEDSTHEGIGPLW